jgi:hypothetical protein
MGVYRLKRKLYGDIIPGYQNSGGQQGVTNYDRYNSLRNMSDADILAEKKRKNSVGIGQMAAITGAGMGIGAVLGGGRRAFKDGQVMKGARRWGIAGGTLAGLYAIKKRSDAGAEADEYNERLADAQRAAGRRERVDWYRNLKGRTNYTY